MDLDTKTLGSQDFFGGVYKNYLQSLLHGIPDIQEIGRHPEKNF